MTYETITVDSAGSSFVITLNRPQRRNAISLLCMEEILAACREAETVGDVRAVIITGGTGYFSAGADLNEARAINGTQDALAYVSSWHRLNKGLETLGKPVLAAIEGFCMTGGCELALACDMRIAGESSTFAVTSSKIGTIAGAGGTQRLARLVGPARALEIMLSGDPIDAREAYRIGLINRLTPKGGALAEAKALAEIYRDRAPLSLAFIKRAVHRGLQMDLTSAIEFESALFASIYGTEDRLEGIGAFLEKRKPQFKGC